MASIWEGLGPPRWSQVGHFSFKTLGMVLPKSVLKLDVFYKLRLGGLQAPFWRLQGSILEGLETIFLDFCKFFGMLPRRRPSSTPSRSPSDDLSHVGRADAAKKMRICQIKERLPRIARLAHLNTQTPRTPRTPRAKNSTTTAENKRVGRRWSPPGGVQLNNKLPKLRASLTI